MPKLKIFRRNNNKSKIEKEKEKKRLKDFHELYDRNLWIFR